MTMTTPVRWIPGAALLAITYCLCVFSCDKPTEGINSSSGIIDSAVNPAILGTYYGQIVTDYQTLNRHTEILGRLTVDSATENWSGCTCIYDLRLYDASELIVRVCTRGKPSRLSANCTDTTFRDVLVGTSDGTNFDAEIKRYRVIGPGIESFWCTISLDLEKR